MNITRTRIAICVIAPVSLFLLVWEGLTQQDKPSREWIHAEWILFKSALIEAWIGQR